jgi:hypothetical protein
MLYPSRIFTPYSLDLPAYSLDLPPVVVEQREDSDPRGLGYGTVKDLTVE